MHRHLAQTCSKLLAWALPTAALAAAGIAGAQVFSRPLPQLGATDRAAFAAGSQLFHQGAARLPAGVLGPHFSAGACADCHVADGRGSAYDPRREPAVGMAAQFVDAKPALIFKLDAVDVQRDGPYGAQITLRAVSGTQPRGRPQLAYTALPGRFADGTPYVLRQPVYRVDKLGYGPLAPATVLSPRLAPQMVGLGLLDAVPEDDILQLAQTQAQRAGPARGLASRIWDPIEEKPAVGRFGWKAGTASLHHQTGLALQQDMGVTTTRFSGAACPAATPCRTDTPELGDAAFLHLLDYQFGLALPRKPVPPPARLAEIEKGRALFEQAQCGACHQPVWTTGKGWFPGMSRRTIYPYTDLLLHDMGDGLADRRLDGALPSAAVDGAGVALAARQWRTAPLWGLGLIPQANGHQQLLHDGRARGVLEAVLWHAGEADAARAQVLRMDSAQRKALVAFVNSL